jgi:Rieske Fe-S protein
MRMAMTRMASVVCAGVMVAALCGCEARKEKPAIIMSGVVNLGPASDFPAGSANTNFLPKYGIVVTNASGTPVAVWPQCTHDGATVKWNPKIEQFECPANGCRYDILGRPTRTPAKVALKAIATQRQADGTLTVDLTQLHGM